MKLADIYSMLFASWLNGGRFSNRGRMDSLSIDPQYNIIYTKTGAKKIFRIAGIKPDNLDLAFPDYLRDKMFELHPTVELQITMDQHPIKLDVTGDKFSRSFSKASTMYEEYKEMFDSQSGVARLTGKTYFLPGGRRLRLSRDKLDNLYQVFLSHKYLFEHVTAGGTVSIVNVFLEVCGSDTREVQRAGDDLYGLLGALNIGVEELRSVNKNYMLQMGPAAPSPTKLNKKFLPQLLFTDENTAAWSSYKSRGLVGGGRNALLFGLDIRSRLPFSVDFFTTGGAVNILLLGKTGSGKTFAALCFAISALAHGLSISCLDLKGQEWIALSVATKATRITFDSQSTSFVNTLRLDDVDASLADSHQFFDMAVNGTIEMFKLAINLVPREGSEVDLSLVLREAVLKVFSMAGVNPDNPATFANTSTLSYDQVLPVLESLKTSNTLSEEQKLMIQLARSRLNAYFGSAGIFASAMTEEVTLGDVLSSQLVIYEFNKNQNQNVSADSLDSIRIFMASYLDSKKQTILKRQGKFMLMLYEELQRCGTNASLMRYISSQATGARSNNAIIIFLMNSLKVLQGKEGQDIRSNITSTVVGLCEDNDIQTLRDDFGLPWTAQQLELFRDKQSIYRNCFAAEINAEETFRTVYKAVVPDNLSRAFRTRTILDE